MTGLLVQQILVSLIVAGAGVYLAWRVTVQWRLSRRVMDGSNQSGPCSCGCHDGQPVDYEAVGAPTNAAGLTGNRR